MSSINQVDDRKIEHSLSSSSLDADQIQDEHESKTNTIYKLFLKLAINKLISFSFSFKFLFLLIILNVVLFHLEKLFINFILVVAFAIG
jgi:hypothetical protein